MTELEHASLCPSRLSSRNHSVLPLRSFVTRIFEPRIPTASTATEGILDCSDAFLVPGGRFLVVNHGICLWDLGIHGAKAPRPTHNGIPARTLRAHEIYPCTNRPHSTLLGLIQYAQQAIRVGGRPALYGGLLIFENFPGYIVAWNTRLDIAIAWRYDHQYIYDVRSPLFFILMILMCISCVDVNL